MAWKEPQLLLIRDNFLYPTGMPIWKYQKDEAYQSHLKVTVYFRNKPQLLAQ